MHDADEGTLLLDTDQLDAMAAAFSVLGRLHQEAPDEQTLTNLWALLDDWPLPTTPAASAGLEQLRAAREAAEGPGTIRTDHARLYGRTATAKVSPYESVHRGREGLVFDEHTLQVRAAYRALALQAPRLNREPDDHIGLELDFVAQSCLRALDALDQDSPADAQRYLTLGTEFFAEHLAQWAPTMLRRAGDCADTHFMRGLAELSLGALDSYAEFSVTVSA